MMYLGFNTKDVVTGVISLVLLVFGDHLLSQQ
jgi:hypothetical protein